MKGQPARRGRPCCAVIGTTSDGFQLRWRDIHEAAAFLGTTPEVLRVYICRDEPYKGYDIDYLPRIN